MLLIPFTFSGSSFFQELLYRNDLFSFGTLWSLQWSGSRKYPHCLHLYSCYANIMNKVHPHRWAWFRRNCKKLYTGWEILYSLSSGFVSLNQYVQGTGGIAGIPHVPGPFSAFCPSALYVYLPCFKQACLGTPRLLCQKRQRLRLWYRTPCTVSSAPHSQD